MPRAKIDIDATLKSYEDATRRGLRRRGFAGDEFDSALSKAKGELDTPEAPQQMTVAGGGYVDPRKKDDDQQRTSDSADPGDRMGHEKKPAAKYWNTIPVTEEQKALYYGLHLHSPDNKFGLHTHVPGGTLGGGHTHGPQNRMGAHHHKEIDTDPDPQKQDPPGIMLDGHHVHQTGENMPSGPHTHTPENFG